MTIDLIPDQHGRNVAGFVRLSLNEYPVLAKSCVIAELYLDGGDFHHTVDYITLYLVEPAIEISDRVSIFLDRWRSRCEDLDIDLLVNQDVYDQMVEANPE